MSASDFAFSVARKRSPPISTRRACERRNSALPNPSEHSDSMISVPPGIRMSSGVTMPLTVW